MSLQFQVGLPYPGRVARPKSYSPELRDKLIDSSAERLALGGTDGLSLRDLAQSVGTSTNAVYTIFGGKDELIRTVVSEALRRFQIDQLEALGDSDDTECLFSLARSYRAWALGHQSMYKVMFGNGPHQMNPIGAGEGGPLLAAIRRLQASGALIDGDPAQMHRCLWAAIHGWVMLELGAPAQPGSDEQFERFLAFGLRGYLATSMELAAAS